MAEMENNLRDLVELGKELGYEGEDLRSFVQNQQAEERKERASKREAEAEARRLEAEEKVRQFELEKLRLQSSQVPKAETSKEEGDGDRFSWGSVLKLIPKFIESDVSKYFMTFEKLMKLVECPPEYWTLLLQSVLFDRLWRLILVSTMNRVVSTKW